MRAPLLRWRRARRRRWLEDREAHGLLTPLPIAFLVVNDMGDFVATERATRILLRARDATVHRLPVDVILGCECDAVDAAKVLGPEWDVLHDAGHPDRDGTMLAVRRSRGRLDNPRYEFGAAALAGAMRDRYLAVANIAIDPGTDHRWFPKTEATHGPPKRGWLRWPAYMRRVAAQRPDVAGGDWNKLARAVWPTLRRKVRMVHILGLAVRWWIPASDPVAVDVGGDHLAVGVVLWPR